jgi:hypothetical protein
MALSFFVLFVVVWWSFYVYRYGVVQNILFVFVVFVGFVVLCYILTFQSVVYTIVAVVLCCFLSIYDCCVCLGTGWLFLCDSNAIVLSFMILVCSFTLLSLKVVHQVFKIVTLCRG